MFKINYKGEIWNYAFVKGGLGLNEEGNRDLAREAIRTYKKRGKKTDIKGNGFEGRMTKDGFVTIGGLGGQHYTCELETEQGKRHPSVIIWRTIDALLN